MNRRSLLRLIGLAPIAAPMAAVAAKAAPQGFGARLMLIDPWSSMVGSTLEQHATALGFDHAEAVRARCAEDGFIRASLDGVVETTRGNGICPPGSNGHHPDGAWAPNAPELGEGDDGRAVAQGYSAAAEAPQDSGSRTGRRNEEVGRDGAGASAEPGRTLGHPSFLDLYPDELQPGGAA